MKDINSILQNLQPDSATGIRNVCLINFPKSDGSIEEVGIPIRSTKKSASMSDKMCNFSELECAGNNAIYHVVQELIAFDSNSETYRAHKNNQDLSTATPLVNSIYKNDSQIIYYGFDTSSELYHFVMVINAKQNKNFNLGLTKCVYFTLDKFYNLNDMRSIYESRIFPKVTTIGKLFKENSMILLPYAIDAIIDSIDKRMNINIEQTREAYRNADMEIPKDIINDILEVYQNAVVIVNECNDETIHISVLLNINETCKMYGGELYYAQSVDLRPYKNNEN